MNKPDKAAGGILLNAVFGVLGLAIANMLGLGLGLTAVNLAVTAVFGIPGLALLFGVRWLF
ncbi:MAG: pro-sigmaK processing inhibitor BofA family protein [Oscillospiraceae bacterium]|nr:pro-sigmaK processing inhibitor BofA family protein [Oscillospiraceae bacterium]